MQGEEERELTGIVATSKVVDCIFFATNELLRVEELSVSSSAHFINNSGLQIYKHSSWNMLPSASLAEKGVEGIISASHCLVTWHLPIRLQKKNTQRKRDLKLKLNQKLQHKSM